MSDPDESTSDDRPPSRRIRHIQPLGPRVLVKILAGEERTTGGLYLPQGVAEKHQDALYGEVVEVARATVGAADDEPTLGENVSGVPAGAFVLFPKDAGVAVPWDTDLRILETKQVLATVDEVDYEAAH